MNTTQLYNLLREAENKLLLVKEECSKAGYVVSRKYLEESLKFLTPLIKEWRTRREQPQ